MRGRLDAAHRTSAVRRTALLPLDEYWVRSKRWMRIASSTRSGADGVDVGRFCDLFGLSVDGAARDLPTIKHPDLTNVD